MPLNPVLQALPEVPEGPVEERIIDMPTLVKRIRAIHFYETEQARFEDEGAQLLAYYKAFYAKQVERCKERIAFHMNDIKAYLEQCNREKVVSPEGTVYYKDVTKVTWPDDELLLVWVKVNCPDALVSKEAVSKEKVKKFIEETGNAPAEYHEETERRLMLTQGRGA